MIKINSKVVITELQNETLDGSGSPTMIVEGLYHKNRFGIWNIEDVKIGKVKPEYAKCLWYNTRNELQEEFIKLEILIEL